MPSTPNALAQAAVWLSSVMTGAIGSILAILAIAGIGAAMLRGSLALRQGARVVLGCFILFGAQVLAGGLVRLASVSPPEREPYDLPPAPQIVLPQTPTTDADPYSGASVPISSNP